jgi:hypothetical protein
MGRRNCYPSAPKDFHAIWVGEVRQAMSPVPIHFGDSVDAPGEVRRPLTDPATGIRRDTEHLADDRTGSG